MKFEKGHNKKGGRIKGTPNKKTQAVRDYLKENNINGIEDLKDLALKNLAELSQDSNKMIKVLATKEINKYNWPQKREHTGQFTGTIIFNSNPKIGTIEKQELSENDGKNGD